MSAILGASADIGAVRMTLGWDTPDAREWLPSALETQYIVPGVGTPAGMEAAAVAALQSALAATPEVGTVVLACQGELQRRAFEEALDARAMVGVRVVGVVEAVIEYLRVTGWLESVDSFALLHAGYASSSISAVDARTGAVLATEHLPGGQLRRMNRDGGQAVAAVICEVLARAEWRPQALVVLGEGANWSGLHEGLESTLPLPVMTPPAPELVLARGAALLGIPDAAPAGRDPWFEEVHAPVLAPERHNGRKVRKQSSGFGVIALMAAGFLAAGTVSAILMFSGVIGQREVGHTSPISAEPPQSLATVAPTVKPTPTITTPPRPTPTTTTTPPPAPTTTTERATATPPPPPPRPPRPGLQLPPLPRIDLPPLPTLPPLQLPKLPG